MQSVTFLTNKALSDDPREANWVLSLDKMEYYVVDGIVNYEGADVTDWWPIVVPEHMKHEMFYKHHETLLILQDTLHPKDGLPDKSVLLTSWATSKLMCTISVYLVYHILLLEPRKEKETTIS